MNSSDPNTLRFLMLAENESSFPEGTRCNLSKVCPITVLDRLAPGPHLAPTWSNSTKSSTTYISTNISLIKEVIKNLKLYKPREVINYT